VELLPVEEEESVLRRKIGGIGPSVGKPEISVFTDSPLSGANAAR
jgi:hypothetical protein